MKRFVPIAAIFLCFNQGCQQPAQHAPAPATPPTPQQGATQQTQTQTPSGSSPSGSADADASVPKWDVAVFVALDSASPALIDRAKEVVDRVATVASGTSSARLAIVAGKKDRKDGAPFTSPAGFAANAFKAIDFGLTPKDAMISAVIGGCDVKATSFPDPHLTTGDGPVVCGKKLLSIAGNSRDLLTHSWLWALEPVRGTLREFFRTDARRLYVFVTNGDAEFFDATSFSEIVGEQSGGKSARVVAAIPQSSATPCSSSVKIGKRYADLAASTAGKAVDICGPGAEQIAIAVQNALGTSKP